VRRRELERCRSQHEKHGSASATASQ
jgi:hypothetical protein